MNFCSKIPIMKIEKIIRVNDWDIRDFILLVLTFSLALIGLVGVSIQGFDMFFLRQLIGFIFLSFLPGICILRILKIHNLETINTLLYSIGLSLGLIMFIGLIINFFLPIFGIDKPITIIPVTVTFLGVILVLATLAYIFDKNFISATEPGTEIKSKYLISFFFLSLLPFLAVLGAMVVTYFQNNAILLLLMLIICFILIIIILYDGISESLFGYAVLMISISLLLHATLVSQYPNLWSVDSEYYFQNLVFSLGLWDSQQVGAANSCLSITMLSPIYSIILNINGIWMFKIFYQLFFALIPLSLFSMYSKIFSKKSAFLSVFFFMSVIVFYGEATLLKRQEIALLFFALLLLLLFESHINAIQKGVLLFVFSSSIIVSHYSVNFLLMILLLIGGITLITLKKYQDVKTGENSNYLKLNANKTFFSWQFIIVFIVLTFSWSFYTTLSTPLTSLIHMGHNVYLDFFQFSDFEIKSPLVTTAIGGNFWTSMILGKFFKVLQYLIQFFIIIGFGKIILKNHKCNTEYIILAFASLSMLMICFILPYITIGMSMSRFYFICLFVLAPLCIIGGITFFNIFIIALKKVQKRLMIFQNVLKITVPLKTIASTIFIFFVIIPYFLISTGFIFDIAGYGREQIGTGNVPASAPISYGKIDTALYNQREVIGAQWISEFKDPNLYVYGDAGYGATLLGVWIKNDVLGEFGDNKQKTLNNYYFYLRTWNIHKLEARVLIKENRYFKTQYMQYLDNPELSHLSRTGNKIYQNGGSQIFKK